VFQNLLFLVERGENMAVHDECMKEFDKNRNVLEQMLLNSLFQREIPVYLLRSRRKINDELLVELTVYFSKDLQAVEDILSENFTIDNSRSRFLNETKQGDLDPLLYVISSAPSRAGFAEWEGFFDKRVIISVNTPFAEVFNASFTMMLEKGIPEGMSEDKFNPARFRELARELDQGFSLPLSQGIADKDPSSSQETLKQEIQPDEQKPAVEVEEISTLDSSKVSLFFNENRKVLKKWISLSTENGLEVADTDFIFHTHAEPPEIPFRMIEILEIAGISSLRELEQFVDLKLEDWEDLYQAFEIARLRGFINRERLTFCDLAYALISAANLY